MDCTELEQDLSVYCSRAAGFTLDHIKNFIFPSRTHFTEDNHQTVLTTSTCDTMKRSNISEAAKRNDAIEFIYNYIQINADIDRQLHITAARTGVIQSNLGFSQRFHSIRLDLVDDDMVLRLHQKASQQQCAANQLAA